MDNTIKLMENKGFNLKENEQFFLLFASYIGLCRTIYDKLSKLTSKEIEEFMYLYETLTEKNDKIIFSYHVKLFRQTPLDEKDYGIIVSLYNEYKENIDNSIFKISKIKDYQNVPVNILEYLNSIIFLYNTITVKIDNLIKKRVV